MKNELDLINLENYINMLKLMSHINLEDFLFGISEISC